MTDSYKILTEEEIVKEGINTSPNEELSSSSDLLIKGKDAISDYGMGFGSGLTNAATYLLGLPGDIQNLANQYLPSYAFKPIKYMGNPVGGLISDIAETPTALPTSSDLIDLASNIPGYENLLNYQPTTLPGRYIKTGTEFAAPGVVGKAKAVSSGVGAIAGLLSQGAEDLTGSETAGAITGISSLLPLTWLANMRRSNAPKLLKDAFEGLTTEQLKDARVLQETAKRLNIPLSGPEAIGTQDMVNLASDVIATRSGSKAFGIFTEGRPRQTREAVESSLNTIINSGGSKQEIAEQIQRVVYKYIDDAKINRTVKAQKAGYTQADTELADPNSVARVINLIDDAMSKSKKGEPTFDALSKLKSRLLTNKKPEVRMGVLDEIYKDIDEAIKLPISSPNNIQKTVSAKLKPILKELDNVLLENPSFAQGRATFERQSKIIVDILERNVGGLAKEGIKPSQLVTFIFDSKNLSPKDVKRIADTLNKIDPSSFNKISKLWMENIFETSMKPTLSGPSKTGGAKFSNQIFGDVGSSQRETYNVVIDAIAKNKGLNPQQTKEFKVGFDNLMRILQRQGRIPAIGSRTASRAELSDIAQQSSQAGVLETISTQPASSLARWIRDNIQQKTYKELAEVMTGDDAIEQMIKLSKESPDTVNKIIEYLTLPAITAQREIEQRLSE